MDLDINDWENEGLNLSLDKDDCSSYNENKNDKTSFHKLKKMEKKKRNKENKKKNKEMLKDSNKDKLSLKDKFHNIDNNDEISKINDEKCEIFYIDDNELIEEELNKLMDNSKNKVMIKEIKEVLMKYNNNDLNNIENNNTNNNDKEDYDSNIDDIDGEEIQIDQKKINIKKLKKNQINYNDLKIISLFPDSVEEVDATAMEPITYILFKCLKNLIKVPKHWISLKSFLSKRRGVLESTYRLPDYIESTGISKLRDPDLIDSRLMKIKAKDKVNPKIGKMEIKYEKLYEAFFKYQKKT